MKEERIGVGEAKAHLSELLERVRNEALIVTVTRHGKPVARIVPLGMIPERGHLAQAKGWLDDDDSFFASIRVIVDARNRHLPQTAPLGD